MGCLLGLMIVGKIIGKVTTNFFDFQVEGKVKKFEFVQVYHKDYGYVLCQVMELERTLSGMIAKTAVIGYMNSDGRLSTIKIPFKVGSEVLRADPELIRKLINLDSKTGAYIGKLHEKDIEVKLNLNKLLTKHLAVMAKSGSGKSYFVGVVLEEILEKRIPLLVIDPHGEYLSLKYPNDNQADIKKMLRFGIQPKNYLRQIKEFEPGTLKINESLSAEELIKVLPKLNNNQLSLLYSAMLNLDYFDFKSLIRALQQEDSNVKWSLIPLIEYLSKSGVFSVAPTPLEELVRVGQCSIVNLKGVEPRISEIIVYKLVNDLFNARKKEKIPPFFLVIEEAHNFIPERGMGSTVCGPLLRNVASEGRKFGLGMCVVTQRPARIDKNVLSQCTTQVLLKVTNPNDVKAIAGSVEGINAQAQLELQNLPVGTALVTGIVDMPLVVDIRPRKTKHGGTAVDIIGCTEEQDITSAVENFESRQLMHVIKPPLARKDLEIMYGSEKKIATHLIPCLFLTIMHVDGTYNILVELVQGRILREDNEKMLYSPLPDLTGLSERELKVLKYAVNKGKFSPASLVEVGISLGDATTLLNHLISKNLIIPADNFYVPNSNLNLDPCQFYRKPEYQPVDYDSIIQPTLTIQDVESKLKPLYTIIDKKECYYIYHELKDK